MGRSRIGIISGGRMLTQDLLAAVEHIRPVLSEHAPRAEADRELSGAAYAAMCSAGLFAMMAPRSRGGYEMHPVECLKIFEAVARIDAAAAWNLEMNQAIACYVAWLPAAGVDDIFRNGIPTIAGALNPPGRGVRTDGGWRITGQVPFGSGCRHAQWLALPFVEMDGDRPRVDPATGQPIPFGAFFPREEATIFDTWHTYGMRGTGSTDYGVRDLYVPDRLIAPVCPLGRPAPGFEGPLYRMWPLSSLLGEAMVSVGVAGEAVDAAVQLCKTKTPAYNAVPLRQQQLAQFQLGKARSRVEAARDTLFRAAAVAYDDVAGSGGLLTAESKIRLQLAACFTAEGCAEAVRLVNDAVGASSIRSEQPFERYFRDAHVLLQHSDKSSARYGSAGRLMLGLENDWVWLSF
jgi:alkylation response protein AidB-like acyl-CoA dehydrogenase